MGIIIIYNMFKAALALAATVAATSGPTSESTSMYCYRYRSYYRRSYSYRYRYYRPSYYRRSYYRYYHRYPRVYRHHSGLRMPSSDQIERAIKSIHWAGPPRDIPRAKDFWGDVVAKIPKKLAMGGEGTSRTAAMFGNMIKTKILRRAAALKRMAPHLAAMETRNWKQLGYLMKALGSYPLNGTAHHNGTNTTH